MRSITFGKRIFYGIEPGHGSLFKENRYPQQIRIIRVVHMGNL